MKKVLSDRRPGFLNYVAMWLRKLVDSYYSVEPASRPSFSEILAILGSHDFKIINAVDSMEVRRFLSSVEGSNCVKFMIKHICIFLFVSYRPFDSRLLGREVAACHNTEKTSKLAVVRTEYRDSKELVEKQT
jgi:hypothetical protein